MSRQRDSVAEDRTKHWVNGDPVTSRTGERTGNVKWTNPRHSDGRRFLRIRLESGAEVWGNDDWVIGQGPFEKQCADCLALFRTGDPQAFFGPCCARHHRPDYDQHAEPIARTHNRLRGTATPYAARAVEQPTTTTTNDLAAREDPFADTPF